MRASALWRCCSGATSWHWSVEAQRRGSHPPRSCLSEPQTSRNQASVAQLVRPVHCKWEGMQQGCCTLLPSLSRCISSFRLTLGPHAGDDMG